MRGVGLPSGEAIEYIVDGQGRRVGKKINGALVKAWLWRGQLQPVAELDGAGNVVARFVYAGGINVPALVVTPTATYRLVTDHLGSVRRVVDVATGAVVQELEYDAWGRVMLDTNPGLQPFGFAGGLYDPETGLVRFGARDYDAETGRWTAKDPIRFGGGVNLYAYAENDPVGFQDVSGNEKCRRVILGGALAATLLVPVVGGILGSGANLTLPPLCESASDAEKAARETFPDSLHNGAGDAYKHCVASCLTAQEYNGFVSYVFGWLNEQKVTVRPGTCPPE